MTNNVTGHIDVLTQHNHWRRCNDENCDCKMVDVKNLGLAIDAAIEVMKAKLVEQALEKIGER